MFLNLSICIIIIIFILFILLYVLNNFLYKIKIKEKFSSNIPKIIHQTAPTDKKKWNKLWFECQNSWHKNFPEPEYKYMMWNDEDLDNLIKNDFSWFYEIYKSYKNNIQRIDIARYFILYKYGGIYADMDYICMKNFYNMLPSNKVSISESPYKNNENLQNALMASNVNNIFWIKLIDEAIIRNSDKERDNDVLGTTGPVLISDVYNNNKNLVFILNSKLFNPNKNSSEEFYSKNLFAKHLGTCEWC
jgi:mannosyltransferase OCH1-like enzyme